MKILMCLVISILFFEVETANDSGWSFVGNPIGFAYPCNGSDDITSSFEANRAPELENSYNVYIQKYLPGATKIKLRFDADASVELVSTLLHYLLRIIKMLINYYLKNYYIITIAVLSSATQHAVPPEIGRKWGTEC